MSVTALRGAPTGSDEPDSNREGSGMTTQYHPDVIELARRRGVKEQSALDALQVRYDRAMARRIAAEDFTPQLTRASIAGSHNADPQGDRAARKIDRERSVA